MTAMDPIPEDLGSLKDILRDQALPVSGTKAQLIARLEEHRSEPSPSLKRSHSPQPPLSNPDPDESVKRQKRPSLSPPVPPESAAPPPPPPAFDNAPPLLPQEPPQDADAAPDLPQADNADDDELEPPVYEPEPESVESRPTDMYLDTIDRSALDFDFERLCSVTLSHNHIYCCLIDGKYFQGRGSKSAAYAHSISHDHHVFINLDSKRVYVLPDGYEVQDPSLSDIEYLLDPKFTREQLERIDRELGPHYDLVTQQQYYPGFIGLNNIKHNSYINSILVSLAHVLPLRNYFLLENNNERSSSSETELVKRFRMFLKKVWNPKQFKPQVSPHELLQQIDLDSKGKFKLNQDSSQDPTGAGGDPVEFLGWFLNTLHRDLGGSRKPNSSIIHSCFQGELRIDDQAVVKTGEYGSKPKFDLDRDIKTVKTPFLFLTLDLPPTPLFQSHLQNDIIPQTSMSALLSKYNGVSTSEQIQSDSRTGKSELVLRRYKLERLPEFLILHVKRFEKNRFGEEKNQTIVNFPLRGVDFKDYVEKEKGEPQEGEPLSKYYDLVSNVTHSSLAGTVRTETQWKTYVHLHLPRDQIGQLVPITSPEERDGGNKPKEVKEEDEKWFEMQDLNVAEIEKSLVGLGESYVQIWERRRPEGKHDLKVVTPTLRKR
ncbi:mRNA splicing protein SAD1 [Sporobolomyces koalae]|uniref:mRNA splicing protein SAD1 n=1 Tax=Sporobolomyces koalae TaxID=500713 RepID=UPI00317A005A